MLGLHRLYSLPDGLAGKLTEVFANSPRYFLPDILFASWNPDCQCVTHGLCVTQD